MKKNGNSTARKVVFTFHSSAAAEVFVAGTFNDWNLHEDPLEKNAKGWRITKHLEPGTYEYRFIVDGTWMDDPVCKRRKPNQYGGENCILEV